MPPESLFRHSLRCPSPLFEDPTSLIDSLHYPKTLNLQNPDKNFIAQPVEDSNNAELCLSLDGYFNEFGSNFFYKDCPGVVNFNDLDNSNKMFTLPGVLSVECTNFVDSRERDIKSFDKNGLRILPSDLWAIRREVMSWVDYPSTYSYGVFCSNLQLNAIKVSDLRRWVIANSPRYGVVIDVYMRDHVCVLFRLCLNAIRREALSFLGHGMNMKTLSYDCPVLGQVLMWIASQLSILYGEMNAKCFAIHIFGQCVLEAANGVLFPWEFDLKERSTELDANDSGLRDVKFGEPLEGSMESKVGKEVDENTDVEGIFVSQVAAAVAALHERSLLEAKIKKLRMPQQLPRYQRMTQHHYVSKRADDERKARSNYRAIIEHDGLPSRKSSNQETSKTKTREELLAEERDYKRRRMSYREEVEKDNFTVAVIIKKMPCEACELDASIQSHSSHLVMRDIIDEYMEEIKQAGGIGCFEKVAEEEGLPRKPPSTTDIALDVNELRKSSSKSSEAIRSTPNHCQKQLHSDHNIRSTTSRDASLQYSEQRGQGHNRHHEQVEYPRSAGRDSHGRQPYSRSPERHKSHGLLHERSSRYRERDGVELTIIKHHEKRPSCKSNYQNNKSSHSLSDSSNNHGVQKDDEKWAVRDRHLRHLYGDHSSNVLAKNAFEDRYNPAESHDTYEDGVYTGNKYVRQEEFHE
ncbi:hypothetical protein GH714_005319 [Hevea brasiliensis]|uniref:CHHC U11-48K-type domain-containing protein n=1 Tax=Hevea brasiliensis TaxID=3981 RepID=A0A6A6KJG7_HEVBR|nr:hypothetical protein GH714_005319 [Hevea brasiliensis]